MAGEDENIIALYERHALAFDDLRGRNLFEKPWLDRFTALVPPRGDILDLGCGAGEPIAASLIRDGFRVTGVDASETLIGLCRERFPNRAWFVADMRQFSLPAKYDGILAWHSFFHLNQSDQRAMFPRFAALSAPGAALMFTAGHFDGVAMGEFGGEPLYHASLSTEEYTALLEDNGFAVVAHVVQDPQCGGATVWLAKRIS
ncbi:methyltransferase [Rhizobium sp. AC44/96]|uniref:class I SAM-dependent methyltransferase n=1 Tax=unclassified Rhizobium TaxID=2613769 RepID=UPI00080FCAF3|nr:MULTISPECIES: class I SAM-dependent methyltransferase [unclassified Rhizobium]MDM9623808.1 class I SAM-dependent methyltransferase [Rhizobium sp. S96]OCJ17797.1 methyltransferase [Rhizobium sp. AC44/96]